jgi:hypothetical protein
VICAQPEFGVSFELPDRPTYGQIEDYDRALQVALEKQVEQTDIQYAGTVLRAATESGLIQNWQTVISGVPLSHTRSLDGLAVLWACTQIRWYIQTLKALDPKAWRALCATPAAIEAETGTA